MLAGPVTVSRRPGPAVVMYGVALRQRYDHFT